MISQIVIDEVSRNLAEISPQLVAHFDHLIEAIPIEFIRPSKAEIIAAEDYVVQKDAPIIAAAKKARVDMLVSLDKKHLLDKPELVVYTGVKIVTPAEAYQMIIAGL